MNVILALGIVLAISAPGHDSIITGLIQGLFGGGLIWAVAIKTKGGKYGR